MHLRQLKSALYVLLGGIVLTACDDDDPVSPTLQPPVIDEVTVGGTSATVIFTPSSTAESHSVEISAEGESPQSQDAPSGTTSVTFDDLSEGVAYTAQVVATRGSDTATSEPVVFSLGGFVLVDSDIEEDVTWTNDQIYLLRGPIFVGRDIDGDDGLAVTLTIEPGTTILGDANAPSGTRGSFLVVTRGSQLIADANADEADPNVRPDPDNVIVFTSSQPRGNRARGDWGGIIINGRAPTNAGDEAAGEGDSGFFGGTDEADDSGILRGVRVEFAGDRVTATDELNGIAFQGVGAGTTVDYVQIHYNVDDGTEPFGGTVSQTHMVMTGIGDDSFDGTDGYRGFIQFGVVQMRGDDGDKAFELSTNGDNPDTATPRSSALIANVTAVGAEQGEIQGPTLHQGLNLREGSNWRVYNTILAGMQRGPVSVDGSTQPYAQNYLDGSTDPDEISLFANSLVWRSSDLSGFDQTFVEHAASNNMIVADADELLPASAFDYGTLESPPNLIPSAMPGGYTAQDVSGITDGLVLPTDGRSLMATDYAGAVAPGTALEDAWYYGWTVWAVDGSDSRPNAEEAN
ncbi:MAG: hypothetical protein GEU90_18645 [Gemmatimonas sp.]|nr:hypothetical protein [Gemmatimonas sp.]